MSYLVMLLGLLFAWLAGAIMLLGYILYRMMKQPGFDKSNITNALRLLSHVCLHPHDFGKMSYPDGKRPFWYVSKDELSEVVDTRPS